MVDEGKKGYAPRGDDHMKPAGGAGWFEPPEDTTISSDTPSWFKVDAVQTQKVAQKRGRGSSLSREGPVQQLSRRSFSAPSSYR